MIVRSNLSEQLIALAERNSDHCYNLMCRSEDLDYAVEAYVLDQDCPKRLVILLKAWSNANVAYAAAAGKHPPAS